ncbi:protein phosphatase Slingshot homolog 3 isoform X5 [Rhea pennata]|uniref:protein phosphatase Slingshot homolog 3 isoform X5 n=1 Tax=Rhea pennata TaxID=8795 RepID=UPI002E26016A
MAGTSLGAQHWPGPGTTQWPWPQSRVASTSGWRWPTWSLCGPAHLSCPALVGARPAAPKLTEQAVRTLLRDVMATADLENITSKEVRMELEHRMGHSLAQHKDFIDNEMLLVLAQMDRPSRIFPHLYLGSEWNAANLEELQQNQITHILNVAREIDNFFPALFTYMNVRVYDEDTAQLLPHWNDTFLFLSDVRAQRGRVLVHCRMGLSRSAATVLAYAMKEFGWPLERALRHVRHCRPGIVPNPGFMRQLDFYQGILQARCLRLHHRAVSQCAPQRRQGALGTKTSSPRWWDSSTAPRMRPLRAHQHLPQGSGPPPGPGVWCARPAWMGAPQRQMAPPPAPRPAGMLPCASPLPAALRPALPCPPPLTLTLPPAPLRAPLPTSDPHLVPHLPPAYCPYRGGMRGGGGACCTLGAEPEEPSLPPPTSLPALWRQRWHCLTPTHIALLCPTLGRGGMATPSLHTSTSTHQSENKRVETAVPGHGMLPRPEVPTQGGGVAEAGGFVGNGVSCSLCGGHKPIATWEALGHGYTCHQ